MPARRSIQADARTAVASVRDGDTVFVATAAATPGPLLEALYARAAQLGDLTLLHFVTDGVLPAGTDGFVSPFAHRTFFVGAEMRALLDRGGTVDYVPLSVAQVPQLVRAGRLRPDVALVQTTRPDADGMVRLGVGVDIAACMIDVARLVVTEANARMPTGLGENALRSDRFYFLVATDRALPEYVHEVADTVSRQVAAYIGSMIDDGSTLQVGLGQIPNEALRFLSRRNHLGIHSDVITDSVLDLMDSGVADGSAKATDRDVAVASYCFGTRRLYDRVDRNPAFSFRPIDRVCAPEVIAA